MSGGIITIIVMIAWGIISAVAQQQAQKQKSKQKRTPSPPPSGTGRTASTPPTGGQVQVSAQPAAPRRSRLEELTERRKAQLEELRRRRQGGASGGSSQVTIETPGPVTAPNPVPPPEVVAPPARRRGEIERLAPMREMEVAPTKDKIEIVEATRESLQANRARSSREREQLRDRATRPRDVVRAFEQPTDERTALAHRERRRRRAADIEKKDVPIEALASVGSAAPQLDLAKPATSANALKSRLRDRHMLRELIVLREVLDPPVGLR